MTVTESATPTRQPPFLCVCVRRASLVLYGAALAIGPLLGYSSVPLFCAMVALVILAFAFGARVRTLAVVTAAGFLAVVAVTLLKPNPKGPDGLIPILRKQHTEAQRP